jgi:hypothetical protein
VPARRADLNSDHPQLGSAHAARFAGRGTAVANAAIDPLRVQWALDAIHVGDLGRQPRRSVAARRAIALLQPPAQRSRTHRATFRRSID